MGVPDPPAELLQRRGSVTCGTCANGRRFAEGSTYCILYGMIIRDSHECTRGGWTERDLVDDRDLHCGGDGGADHGGAGLRESGRNERTEEKEA